MPEETMPSKIVALNRLCNHVGFLLANLWAFSVRAVSNSSWRLARRRRKISLLTTKITTKPLRAVTKAVGT